MGLKLTVTLLLETKKQPPTSKMLQLVSKRLSLGLLQLVKWPANDNQNYISSKGHLTPN